MNPSTQPSPSDNPAPSNGSLEEQVAALLELLKSTQETAPISQARSRHGSREARVKAQANDPILKALDDEIEKGDKAELPTWEEVEMLSEEKIDKENTRHLKKYEDFWGESTGSPEEIKATEDAYRQAFERFPEIYRSIGWSKNDDIIFNAENLSAHRELLIEAIFAIEHYRMKYLGGAVGVSDKEQSRACFEYSRLPRLLTILVRLENRRNDCRECRKGECVDWRLFDAETILKVLIQAGRTFQRVNLADGLNQTSLEDLLKRCYARRILSRDDLKEHNHLQYQFHLIYDCMDALDFSSRFREIRDPLTYTFYLRYKSQPIHEIFEMVHSLNNVLDGIERFPPFPLGESSEPSFASAQFNLEYLQDFGGLRIEWTNSLEDHLKIFTGPREDIIRIFAHPTYLYSCQDFNRSERDFFQPTYVELAATYALLFQPTSRRNSRELKTLLMTVKDKHSMLDPNPTKSPFKEILEENFFSRCSLPPAIQSSLNISDPSSAITNISAMNQNKSTSTPMREILSMAPFFPEDIRFMMQSVFEHDLSRPDLPFLRFQYFSPRLRLLKTYLDSRQPQTLREMWMDRRDARAWWTFWGWAFFMLMTGLTMSTFCVAVIALLAYRA
ncbi:hypothetical protein BO71DRAFT_394976 [Aspergillus ellipticus CBS 707.79]|uniref:Uncharacterized protein n=1 Tax=Aspergillus ellipticus CBS 707.79 TaxID=1448320 RepID=A0A319DMJ8_9EURO|nr:hypothetical protein BO71DRAFT_394976 [Aspergillus ellipticus CBS 707.79]